jgi:hypothetical protein
MSDAAIRSSIKTLMDSVTGIGMVHDYRRWTDDEAQLEALFQKEKNGPLHGWEITRDGIPQLGDRRGDKYKAVHTYIITGHYAIKDSVASEKLFNLVVDTIVQKFIDSRLPNTEGHSLPTVSIKEWMFADILCHRAEIRLSVTEIVAKTPEADQELLKLNLTEYLKPGDKATVGAEINITQ